MQKIREQKNDAAPFEHVIQKYHRSGDVCAGTTRLVKEHFLDRPQNVATTLARWKKQFNLVGEQQQAYLVATARRGRRQRRSDFDRRFALAVLFRAKGRRR